MNVSLPKSLKDFVDQQVTSGGYGSSSEYVRELIRNDSDRLRLRGVLMDGATSPSDGPTGRGYFASLRKHIRLRSTRTS